MASASKGKGWVAPLEWAKHLKKFGKRLFNRRVRNDGKNQIKNRDED